MRYLHTMLRVRDLDRALRFYSVLGFKLIHRAEEDDVAIIRNELAQRIAGGGA